MGADGGLTWVDVLQPSKLARATELISLFGCLEGKWRDEDYEWLKDNPIKECVLFGKYGTDVSHDGLRDLVSAFYYKFENDHYTFAEVAEDLATRQSWQLYNLHPIEELVFKCCDYSLWLDYRYPHYYSNINIENQLLKLDINCLGSLSTMVVRDWLKEVKTLIDVNRVYSVETWT